MATIGAACRQVVEDLEWKVAAVGAGRDQHVGETKVAGYFVPWLTIDDMQGSRLEERSSLSPNRRTSSVFRSYQHEGGVRYHRPYRRDGLDQLSQSLIALKGPAIEHNRPARWNSETPAKPLRVASCGWNHDARILPLM